MDLIGFEELKRVQLEGRKRGNRNAGSVCDATGWTGGSDGIDMEDARDEIDRSVVSWNAENLGWRRLLSTECH